MTKLQIPLKKETDNTETDATCFAAAVFCLTYPFNRNRSRDTHASYAPPRAQAAVVPPMRKTGSPQLAKWRQNVAPTVIAMAAEMGPDELTARAVAQRMGLQDPQIWRALPKGAG